MEEEKENNFGDRWEPCGMLNGDKNVRNIKC